MMSDTSLNKSISDKRNARQLSILIFVSMIVAIHATFFDSEGASGHLVRQFGEFLASLFNHIGLLNSTIGLAGGFPASLYVEQIAIALSGAFLFGAYLASSVISTGVPLSVGYEKNEQRLMERYRLNKTVAALLQRLILVGVSFTVILICGFFVGAALFGWFVVNIASKFILIFFSVCFVFLPACAVIALIWAMLEYLSRDLKSFVRQII